MIFIQAGLDGNGFVGGFCPQPQFPRFWGGYFGGLGPLLGDRVAWSGIFSTMVHLNSQI